MIPEIIAITFIVIMLAFVCWACTTRLKQMLDSLDKPKETQSD